MSTIELINHISKNHLCYHVIVICDQDDLRPMDAIERLSDGTYHHDKNWRINGTIERHTLLIY